jgi:hypothetical protein
MSAYLKKSVAAIVMAMSLGHAVDTLANSSTGPEYELDPIHVFAWDNPYDVANDAFDWTIADYNAWDVGMSDDLGGGGGGGGGGEDPSPTPTPCELLQRNKPANCPNPIPYPNGYAYGRDQYPGGSGIPRLIYWIDFVGAVDPTAREFARRALSHHTIDLTQPFVTMDTANERLLLSVQTACHLQQAADRANFSLVGPTQMELNCLEVLERLQAEAGDPGFRGYFYQWLDREGIHLDDLGIPETVIDWFAPNNSLRIRYNTITADATCSKWWIDAQANQCTF